MRTAKRFIEFYACGTEGKAGGKPTTHSIDGFWRRFSPAWARQTRNPILTRSRNRSRILFMGHSKKKHNLPTELREKHFLTLSDTRILQEQLWRNDWYNYKHERYRVQNSGAIVLFVCTSGRVGEFSESSAYAGSEVWDITRCINREIQRCSIAKDMQSQRARRRELYERRRQLTVDELEQCRMIQPQKLTANNIVINWGKKQHEIQITQVQLTDIEDSARVSPGYDILDKQVGNWMWRSPEAHTRGRVNKPSDIFSFGVVCIYAVLQRVIFAVGEDELAEGEEPLSIVLERQISYFADEDGLNALLNRLGNSPRCGVLKVIRDGFNKTQPRKPFSMWENVDADFKDLISGLTNFDPAKRLTAQEALAHIWFIDLRADG
ncbi:MAG: hypothetical protein Q9161_000903 [Pseudevernia consocians]